jgi:signal transduction histidine kinase
VRMGKAPSIERIEAQALRRQLIAFCILTSLVIAALLLLHIRFASLLGEPSTGVVLILALAFSAKIAEWIWLWRRKDGISGRMARIETAISMLAVFLIAALLAVLTNRDDVPYFVLLAIPILQCAYRFGLIPTVATIVAAIGMIFTWSEHLFFLHTAPSATEILESVMISVVYCVMGLLVWYLVHQLEIKQAKLYRNMLELEATREKLVVEERLAAIGRLASGVAHEVRNPVAMIASSLATASDPSTNPLEREEMFALAAREARRLENLTSDLLTYARPSQPQRTLFPIADIVSHVVNMTKVRSGERSIAVFCEPCDDLRVEIDPSQIESALVNLSLNALDATPDGGQIAFRIRTDESMVAIEVENSGDAISPDHILRIFEPFFTTKPHGTGLGLAIARTVARSHGGDLWVSQNRAGAVTFTMSLLVHASQDESGEAVYGQGVDS